MKFWEHPTWIKIKTSSFTTDEVLTRVQFLKVMGAHNYSEENYQKYLNAMSVKEEAKKQEEEEQDD